MNKVICAILSLLIGCHFSLALAKPYVEEVRLQDSKSLAEGAVQSYLENPEDPATLKDAWRAIHELQVQSGAESKHLLSLSDSDFENEMHQKLQILAANVNSKDCPDPNKSSASAARWLSAGIVALFLAVSVPSYCSIQQSTTPSGATTSAPTTVR